MQKDEAANWDSRMEQAERAARYGSAGRAGSSSGAVGGQGDFREGFRARAYEFALATIRLIDQVPREQVSKVIGDQLLRSATSIGANIEEAQSASSRRDYINFFTYALKSANETKYWLRLMRDSGRARTEEIETLLREVGEIANVLGASVLTLKKTGRPS
jgi:four helix bundle protein